MNHFLKANLYIITLIGGDSFRTFEEVLQIAQEKDVDFILLGGDLFHENKPSFKSMQTCIDILRKYTFGDKPVQFQIRSDQSKNFNHPSNFCYANYLDQNLNVSIPVFSIHGNHDDPVGVDPRCAVENLAAAGLVNYFGKHTSTEITLAPILLQKEEVKIALYGLGSIPEERLYRIMSSGNFNYLTPEDDNSWFNIVVVHQNRTKRGNTKYLPEKFLSNLPNFVVWGHEHESIVNLDYCDDPEFYICQPGSTVATSLCEAEALPKHCVILNVVYDDIKKKHDFKPEFIRLKTVRPMIWETVNIDEELLKSKYVTRKQEFVENFCKEKVNSMIKKGNEQAAENDQSSLLPLIRLRIQLSDDELKFHAAKFSAQFSKKVANPNDIILFTKRKGESKTKDDEEGIDFDEMNKLIDRDVAFGKIQIEDIIHEYFENSGTQLDFIPEKALTLAVKEVVEKESTDAIDDLVEEQTKRARNYLKSITNLKEEAIMEEIKNFKEKSSEEDLMSLFKDSRAKPKVFEDDIEEEEDDDDVSEYQGRSAAKRGRGRGGKASTSKAKGPAKKKQFDDDFFD